MAGNKPLVNQKRTVVTKGSRHVAVADQPDLCRVPGSSAPQPFDNYVESERLGAAASSTVLASSQPICLATTEWGPPSEPKHAGTNGGVASNAYRGHAKAATYSPDLRVEKVPVVRDQDLTTHNWGQGTFNAPGKVLKVPAGQQFDIAAAVAHLQKQAPGTKSKGKCARYTREAINEGGIDLERTGSAKDYGASLEKAGFEPVANQGSAGYVPKAGDVAVLDAVPKHPDGHMCMFDGTQWISDFRQSSMGTSTYAGADWVVYRWP